MSTRCNVVFKNEAKVMQMYHHHDGYPDGVGAMLQKFLNNYNGEEEPYAMAVALNDEDSSFKLEGKLNLHGDIEYLYVVNTDEKQVKCYSVFMGKQTNDEELINGNGVGKKTMSHYSNHEYDMQKVKYVADFAQPYDEIVQDT